MCTKVTDQKTQRQAKRPNSPHSVTPKFLSQVYLGVCFVPFTKFSHFLLRDLSTSSDVFISQGLCASPASTPCPVTVPPLGQIMQTLFFYGTLETDIKFYCSCCHDFAILDFACSIVVLIEHSSSSAPGQLARTNRNARSTCSRYCSWQEGCF